ALAEPFVGLLDRNHIGPYLADHRHGSAWVETPVKPYGLVNVVGGNYRVDLVVIVVVRRESPVRPSQCGHRIRADGFNKFHGVSRLAQHTANPSPPRKSEPG